MDISVKGKKLNVGDALRAHVEEHLNNAVGKYFNNALDANVTFSREAYRIRADILIQPGPRGLIVQGVSEADDPYAAFDGALDRTAKQLRRHKRRLTNHHKGHGQDDTLSAFQYVFAPEDEDEEMTKDARPAIIAEMTTEIATLSVSEAVIRLDLADVLVVMFQNKASGGLNVV